MPKLINSEPHSGANSNDQTHFLRTGPAEVASLMSVTHNWFCLDLCQIRVIIMLNAIHMKAKQREIQHSTRNDAGHVSKSKMECLSSLLLQLHAITASVNK
jgi:hypothetical protein